MKAILNTVVKIMLALAVIVTSTITSNAQFGIGGPGSNGSGINANGTTNGSPTVPFDGGMSLVLLASGIGYGAKKLRKQTNVYED